MVPRSSRTRCLVVNDLHLKGAEKEPIIKSKCSKKKVVGVYSQIFSGTNGKFVG